MATPIDIFEDLDIDISLPTGATTYSTNPISGEAIEEITVTAPRPIRKDLGPPYEPELIKQLGESAEDDEQPASNQEIDKLRKELEALENQPDAKFDASVEKYKRRLSPYVALTPKMNFFELASDLGAGLLSTPNTGGASAFTGLGVGFTRASERMRANDAENRKAKREIGLQAAQLAMQDERSALEYLRQLSLKDLDYKNKRGPLLTFEYVGADGKVVRQTVRDHVANDEIINDLIEKKNAIEVKSPSSVVNIDQGGGEREKRALDRQYAAEDEVLAKQRAGVSAIANVNEAQEIAARLGPDNFGEVARLTMYPRKLLDAFGYSDETAQQILGDQILLNQISMGFTMDIVSRTKGAISNREMELFIQASPGLGSNYNGFMKQSDYLKRIAQRDVDFYNAYVAKADELEEQAERGEISASKVYRELTKFETDWYDNNLLFDADETAELEAIVKGGYRDSDGYVYDIDEGFDGKAFAEGWRKGQDQEVPSTYTQNQSPQLARAIKLKDDIENGVGKYQNLSADERSAAIAKIDAMIAKMSKSS